MESMGVVSGFGCKDRGTVIPEINEVYLLIRTLRTFL